MFCLWISGISLRTYSISWLTISCGKSRFMSRQAGCRSLTSNVWLGSTEDRMIGRRVSRRGCSTASLEHPEHRRLAL